MVSNLHKVGLYFTKEYNNYNFGNSHPLRPLRLLLAYSLFEKLGLLKSKVLEEFEPRHATKDEILRVHALEYVEAIQKLSEYPSDPSVNASRYGLGLGDNPIFKGMYDASTLICGASLMAAEKVLLDDNFTIAFNPAGGLHHAMKNRASGFCIFNDIAVAIAHLKTLKSDIKVAYVDIDCHHGDGVQTIFYDDPNVLTINYHQDGRTLFPGTGHVSEIGEGDGKGYSINFPLMPRTSDKMFLKLFRQTLPKILAAYKPDILISQLGVDTYWEDPLTQMGFSLSVFRDIAQTLKTSAKEYCQDRWLALGGGGYLMNVVPRAWALFLAKMVGEELENKLPEEWYNEFKSKVTYEKTPYYLWDRADYIKQQELKYPEKTMAMIEYRNSLIELCEKKYIPNLVKRKNSIN